MKAKELVYVAGDRLLGRTVWTEAIGYYTDLVLMDLQMPWRNGPQATRKIRAEFPGVRVIMTTFNDSQEWKAARVASGVDQFIPKECLRDKLPGAIAQLFSGRAAGAEGERP